MRMYLSRRGISLLTTAASSGGSLVKLALVICPHMGMVGERQSKHVKSFER